MLAIAAKDIMTREVVTVRKGTSVDEVLRIMACSGISGLPVVDVDGNLEGIITESDILLKGQLAPSAEDNYKIPIGFYSTDPEGMGEAYRKAQAQVVEEAMTRRVLTFAEDSLVVDIARAMVENAINRVPVVDGRKVVGIISRKDVVRALAKESSPNGGCDDVKSGCYLDL